MQSPNFEAFAVQRHIHSGWVGKSCIYWRWKNSSFHAPSSSPMPAELGAGTLLSLSAKRPAPPKIKNIGKRNFWYGQLNNFPVSADRQYSSHVLDHLRTKISQPLEQNRVPSPTAEGCVDAAFPAGSYRERADGRAGHQSANRAVQSVCLDRSPQPTSIGRSGRGSGPNGTDTVRVFFSFRRAGYCTHPKIPAVTGLPFPAREFPCRFNAGAQE